MSSSYGVADWAMVCLLAALWVQISVSVGSGWPHNVLWHIIRISWRVRERQRRSRRCSETIDVHVLDITVAVECH